ncbi:hypothetical protein V5799_012201 [Amblyomma americanum]|uniref:Uncharacterized protein n=1 Tax=Amblyomma americanum TaxID=6943 RepID=A0AAQ4EEQ5_AMBAM
MERQRTRLALEAEVGAVPNTPETETESGTQPPTKRQKGTHAPSFLECRDNRLDTAFPPWSPEKSNDIVDSL